jgi:hypothetical protein
LKILWKSVGYPCGSVAGEVAPFGSDGHGDFADFVVVGAALVAEPVVELEIRVARLDD